MNKYKIGDVLIAKKDVYMDEEGDLCLKGGKRYMIKNKDDKYIIIKSETADNHYWPFYEISYFFFEKEIELNKRIKVL